MATGWKLGPLGGALTSLRSYGINIVDVDGWDGRPSVRSRGNVAIAYNDGVFSDPDKWFESRELPLKILLLDSALDGGAVTHPAGPEGQLRENIDLVNGLLYSRNSHLALRKSVPAPRSVGGFHEREAVVEVLDSFEVDEAVRPGDSAREMLVRFEMVEGLWRQIETLGASAPRRSTGVTGVTTTSQAFSVVTGGNAPVRGSNYPGVFEVEFVANSAIVDPRIEIDATGEFVQYSGTVAAGETITFDVGVRTIVIDDSGTLTRGDSGRSTQHAWWLRFEPNTSTAVTASVQSASDFDCEVRWYDRWI